MAAPSMPVLCAFCHQEIPAIRPRLRVDLTGQVFHYWTVQHFAYQKKKQAYWCCVCRCGGVKAIRGYSLTSHNSQSCGCWDIEQSRLRPVTHGKTRTSIYVRWVSMLGRCTNPQHHAFADYGARGITVCQRWQDSFEAFYADMGEPPVGMTLERRDNDGPYNKDNCYWASRIAQANNKRNNHVIVYREESHTLAEWARIQGISAKVIARRLALGWSIENALATPVNLRLSHPKLLRVFPVGR